MTAKYPIADQHSLLAAVLRRDFYSFVQAAFPIVSGGARLQRNWHLEAMAHALAMVLNGSTRRLIITVPPRSLKPSLSVRLQGVGWNAEQQRERH